MAKVRLLGNIKSQLDDLLVDDIDELKRVLRERGIEDDVIIAVNGVELSLIDKRVLDVDDIITIASIVHGG